MISINHYIADMGKTAIIVEDEIFVALDLERILTDAGYSVVGCCWKLAWPVGD